MLSFKTLHTLRPTATRSGNAPWRLVRRISVGISVGVAFLATALNAHSAAPANDNWSIRIIPATKSTGPSERLPSPPPPPAEPGPGGARPQTAPAGFLPSRVGYYQVYRSIPFSHAEYAANPSYRQETALGLLFNQFPYTSINKNMGVPRVPRYGYVTPYSNSTWTRSWMWNETPPFFNSVFPYPNGYPNNY